MRRNAMVGVQKGAEAAGYEMVLAGHVARALNAALVLVDLTTREDGFLRERVAMPVCKCR